VKVATDLNKIKREKKKSYKKASLFLLNKASLRHKTKAYSKKQIIKGNVSCLGATDLPKRVNENFGTALRHPCCN
jgi:hypothetical protein